jgi:hypothetical protein
MREERIMNPVSPFGSGAYPGLLNRGTDSYPHSTGTASEQDADEAEEDDTFADLGLQEVEHDDDLIHPHGVTTPGRVAVTFSDDGEEHALTGLGSPSSTASRMSVTSLLAMKRERIERQRRESVMMSSSFSETSKNDTKIDKNRTLTMIKGRAKPVSSHSLAASIPE